MIGHGWVLPLIIAGLNHRWLSLGIGSYCAIIMNHQQTPCYLTARAIPLTSYPLHSSNRITQKHQRFHWFVSESCWSLADCLVIVKCFVTSVMIVSDFLDLNDWGPVSTCIPLAWSWRFMISCWFMLNDFPTCKGFSSTRSHFGLSGSVLLMAMAKAQFGIWSSQLLNSDF